MKEIMRRLEKLESSRIAALQAMNRKSVLDELEEMMSYNIFDSEAENARYAERRRQWGEFCTENQVTVEYQNLPPVQKSMYFWKWQEQKGYITHEQLVKLAGKENTIARWFRELPGIDPEEWPTPFPEYPEYNGEDVWNM